MYSKIKKLSHANLYYIRKKATTMKKINNPKSLQLFNFAILPKKNLQNNYPTFLAKSKANQLNFNRLANYFRV